MKKCIQLLGVLVLVSIIYCSCTLKKRGNYLPTLKTEIPEVLMNNSEVIAFIKKSDSDLNLWSVKLEDLAMDCEPFIGKTESELSEAEKNQLGKVMMELVSNTGQFAVRVAEMQQNASAIEYNLNEKELKAMTLLMTHYQTRIDDLNNKYLNYGNEEEYSN